MAGSTYGNIFKITTWGESHGPALGVVIDGCPAGLDIPMLIANYNELRFEPSVNTSMRLDALPDDKLPTACISCGKCTQICPQKIDIPAVMKAFSQKLTTITKWSDVCAARERNQK